ncbi:MAG: hypothetical protein AB8B93_06685 [Pseudomonadales bacterium]
MKRSTKPSQRAAGAVAGGGTGLTTPGALAGPELPEQPLPSAASTASKQPCKQPAKGR